MKVRKATRMNETARENKFECAPVRIFRYARTNACLKERNEKTKKRERERERERKSERVREEKCEDGYRKKGKDEERTR